MMLFYIDFSTNSCHNFKIIEDGENCIRQN